MNTIIDFHPGNEAYDGGWYIMSIDEDGYCFDAIGPYDTEEEAKRYLVEMAEAAE